MSVVSVTNYLISLGNPELATHTKGYFKTGRGAYAEGDLFLGIRVPVIRKSLKKFKELDLKESRLLLHSPYHEIRLFALLKMVELFQKSDDTQRGSIYKAYLTESKYINNWDLVDSSAHKIVGPYLEKRDRRVLYELAHSKLLWERRIAMLSTFYFIKIGQYDDTLKLAEILLEDKEDLIHKAVGWMLREVGNKEKEKLLEFLQKYAKSMPRTMLRYAIEKFPKEERTVLMQR